MKMQQNRLANKQQQQETQQQQHTNPPHVSGQNALSQNLQQSAEDINNKLAANKTCSDDAGAFEATTATDAIRSIRFRAQIDANANNNNKNDCANGTRRATSKAQEPFGANGNSVGDNEGSNDAATTADTHTTTERERGYYELTCRINYGDFRQVQVQFHSSDRRCCAFSWKRKFRRTTSGTATKRQRQQQPTVRRVLRKQQQRQRYGVWLTTCQQERRQRHDSLLSSNETHSDAEDEEAEENELTEKGAEKHVAKSETQKETNEAPLAVEEGVEDDVANKTLVVVNNETSVDTNDLSFAPSIMALCVNTSERAALKSNIADFRNANDDETKVVMPSYFDESHNKIETNDENCVVVATNDTFDLIDFTVDDLCNADTFTTTDSDTTLTNFAIDVAVDSVATALIPAPSVPTSCVSDPSVAHRIAVDAAIVTTAYTQTTVTQTNTLSDDSSAAVFRTLTPNICSIPLIVAEVSGADLLVGDCKGVGTQKMKVNQVVAADFIEWINCDGCNQLTTHCGGDQNRGIGSVSTKNSKHIDPPTELREIHHNNNNNSFTPTTTSNGTTATITTTRTNSQTPSPILSHHYGKKSTTTTTAATSLTVGGTLLEKKTQSKLLPSRGKALLQKTHQQQRSAEEVPASTVGGGAVTERLDAIELQRLKYLNRHSCNGRLDYEAIERHLEQTELQEAQHNKSIEVLGVLLQYAVHDLDAFACPRIKAEKNKIENYLNTTLRLLDDAKTSCTRLQDQLCDKEGYYSQREEDLQALHRCEIEKAHTSLTEYQTFAQTKFSELETQLQTKDAEHKRLLDSYRLELDNKLVQSKQQLEAYEERELKLKERLSALTISEQTLNDKLTSAEHTYNTHLKAAAEREQELNERLRVLTKELDSLRASKENRERELRDKLNLSQDEISVLRSSQRSFNESLDRGSSGIGSPRNSSTSELARLQSEADSLNCVLELKQKEISKLTKQNEELMRDAEERAVLQGKISLLESSNEMLKSELEIKSEKEKDFQRQIDGMQKTYKHEMDKRKRLSVDNEVLQWQLKQRSEQLHIVETKLHELSAQESINASALSSLSGSFNRSQLLNGSPPVNIQMDDNSPPTSPVVKGVIEKPDSVSWILEMDDETPEAAASKMVTRAGSFRSVERSPSTRRQLSACSSIINTSLNCVGGNYSNGNNTLGPNPLSQSMSATSVIRQHSSDVRHEFNNRAHARIRSKSVCVKGSETTTPTARGGGGTHHHTGSIGTKSGKKLMRQSSGSACSARKQHQLELINWKESISSSSPNGNAIRPRTSTMCSEVAEEQQQQQGSKTLTVASAHDTTFLQRTPTSSTTSQRKLITCDTSNLNSGERLNMMQSLPTHSSVHDLKKKFHEIQESAGEAMVSGTNSEDEGCSASSDEIVCSVSTSSATTGSTSSLKNSHMSLEEVLLLEKSLSLNGTPMEVSWSDDQEVFTTGSTV